MTDEEILTEMGAVRQKTIAIYKKMAGLTDAGGFTIREPGQPDLTLELIRAALRDAPEPTRVLLRQITENDQRVTALTIMLAGREK